MSSLEVSKLFYVKTQLYGLGFANATFYLSSFKLLVLFTFTWLLFTSPTFYSTSSSYRHSNSTFTQLDFSFYTTADLRYYRFGFGSGSMISNLNGSGSVRVLRKNTVFTGSGLIRLPAGSRPQAYRQYKHASVISSIGL